MALVEEKVARRYAKALLNALQPNQLGAAVLALKDLAALWQQDLSLQQALLNPAYGLKERSAACAEICSRLFESASGMPKQEIDNLFGLLLENNRLSALPRLAELFEQMVRELKQQLRLEITSASELSAAERSGIEDKIKAEFGKLAEITWLVDQNMLGGLLVKCGDRLLDSSVRGALERFSNQFSA